MTALPKIDIFGRGSAFSVFVDGTALPRRFWSYDDAAVAAQRFEERLRQGVKADRPCICCGQTFRSEHRFNRLCPLCCALA